MAVTDYRGVTITSGSANDYLSEIVLSTDDEQGRILKFELWNGGTAVTSTTGLSARFYIDVNGNPMWQDMQPVSGTATATWSAALKMGGITAGKHRAEIRVTDTDGGIVATRPFVANVQRGVIDGADSEVMTNAEDLLAEVETINLSIASDGTLTLVGRDGTVTTSTSAKDATTSANTAASAANTAATAANTAADAANDAAARAETAAKPTEEMFASYHALLKAGASEGIASDANPVQSSFLRRASGSAEGVRDGIATIECIKGNTVGWNQLLALGIRTVESEGVTATMAADGSVTLSGTPTGSIFITLNQGTSTVDVVAGHKYVILGGSRARSIYIRINNFVSAYPDTIYTATISGPQYVYVMCDVNADLSTAFKSYPQIFDLTAMFGAGNEPSTVEEFEALYPLPYYAYDPGTLKPAMFEGIETVGFNQWDEEMEPGIIVGATGLPSTSGFAEYRRSKNYIDVFPNTVYSITSPNTSLWMVFYDANKQPIPSAADSYWYRPVNGEVTTPANARYMLFNTKQNYTTYDGTIAIHLKWSGYRDGEYEEYWKSQREIAIAEHFPTGMKAAGTAADALYKDHADHVVGEVDLGTLTWLIDSNHNRVYSYSLTQLIKAPSWSWGTNIRCANYTTTTGTDTDKCISVYKATDRNAIYIKDSSLDGKTAEEVKAALSGVILYYELATPTTVEIDPPLNLGYKVSDFGTERVMLGDGVISAPPVFDIAYGYTAESLRDAAASIVAPVENHLAQDNYAIGSYLVRNGVLYKVTAAIARNESIIPGTNVAATTVMAEIAAING